MEKYTSVELERNYRNGVQEMAHHLTSMSRVEHPSKHFGESIRDGKDT